MINQLYEAKLFAEWIASFKLSFDLDDYDGPAMVSEIDGAYIGVVNDEWHVHVAVEERTFSQFLNAALHLWFAHSRDNILNNG